MEEVTTSLTTILFVLGASLGVFALCALSPYQTIARLIGRAWIAGLVGVLALLALVIHIVPHFTEFIEATFGSATASQYALGVVPFLFIALLGFWVESLHHSHEHEPEHAVHSPTDGLVGNISSVTRMLVLALHAFLDGHIMASVGISWLLLPFVFHKGVDGLVVNGERSNHRLTAAWRWRVAIQLIATSAGAFLHLEAIPELIHVGLVAAVIGLYSGSLLDYVRQRASFGRQEESVVVPA